MWQYNYTNELYHYGVLGMKWGRRKRNSITGDSPKARTFGKVMDGAPKKRNSGATSGPINQPKKVDKKKTKNHNMKENVGKAVKTGSQVVSGLLTANILDDVFYGGAGKKAIKTAGRAAVSGVLRAMGHTNIRWSD